MAGGSPFARWTHVDRKNGRDPALLGTERYSFLFFESTHASRNQKFILRALSRLGCLPDVSSRPFIEPDGEKMKSFKN
jgi:hypothetical protein